MTAHRLVDGAFFDLSHSLCLRLGAATGKHAVVGPVERRARESQVESRRCLARGPVGGAYFWWAAAGRQDQACGLALVSSPALRLLSLRSPAESRGPSARLQRSRKLFFSAATCSLRFGFSLGGWQGLWQYPGDGSWGRGDTMDCARLFIPKVIPCS